VACSEPPCDYNDSVLAPEEPGVLSINDGDGMTAVQGANISPVVQLTDHEGTRACLATIQWTPAENSGAVAPSETNTDDEGMATTAWTLGQALGAQSVTATVVNSDPPLTATFTATVVAPARLEIVSGDGQSAAGGTALGAPLRVRLAYEDGAPGPDTFLTWEVSGGGVLASGVTTTDEQSGESENTWTLGPAGTPQGVTVSEPGGSSVTFTATATGTGPHPKAKISAYNNTATAGLTVTITTPYDGQRIFGPLGLSGSATDSLQVEVGVAFAINAALGAQSQSLTCTTLASIIPDPNDPGNTGTALVSVSIDGTGGLRLTCSGGWQATLTPLPPRQEATRARR
jgi:hypothetical protein